MAQNNRPNLTETIKNEINYESDCTCCVCHDKGLNTQIHHIDKNSSNNNKSNLAVLCLNCHSKAHTTSSMAQNLTPSLIKKYKKEWLKLVAERRANYANLLGNNEVKSNSEVLPPFVYREISTNQDFLVALLERILTIHKAEKLKAKAMRDSGITSEMINAGYNLIDFYESVFLELASYYPPQCFEGTHPALEISNIISSKFKINRIINEINYIGSSGGMLSTIVSGHVAAEVEQLIESMVSAVGYQIQNDEFDILVWRKKWYQKVN